MVNRQKKALGWLGTITQGSRMVTGKKLGRAINDRAVDAVVNAPSYKKGGKIRKNQLIKAHAGEVVLNKKVVTALKKLMH